MSKFVFYPLLLLVFIVSSCNEKVDKLAVAKAEVMKIHDDSMAEIGKIRTYSQRLQDLKSESADSTEILELISMLENADEEMMLWMSNYKEPKENLSIYFEEEKKKVSIVAESIYKSLDMSKAYFNE